MGIKDILNKDSWMDAACLRWALFWPGPSKSLVTTADNAVASARWEEVIVYHCKPPVSDLFVKESCFDGKGFKMIAYIDVHFNLSGAVDSLGYIFNMIDIKQAPEESVVTLKARFTRVFASLKMGGISIDASLQVSLCSMPSIQLIKPMFRNSILGVISYLLPAFKRLLSSASHTTRILGRDLSAAMENQSTTHWQTRPAWEIIEIPMKASWQSLFATT
jgi:hypothetical protein